MLWRDWSGARGDKVNDERFWNTALQGKLSISSEERGAWRLDISLHTTEGCSSIDTESPFSVHRGQCRSLKYRARDVGWSSGSLKIRDPLQVTQEATSPGSSSFPGLFWISPIVRRSGSCRQARLLTVVYLLHLWTMSWVQKWEVRSGQKCEQPT